MKLFGLEVRRATPVLSPVSSRGGWWPLVREPFTGAWQRNKEIKTESVLAHHAVYSCITRISQDIGKLRPKLVEQEDDGIWTETTASAFSGVLNQPNRFQNYIQFQEWWITSKLIHGNAYALLSRDGRGTVQNIYLLDPTRVTVLVSPDGEVFYNLRTDYLSELTQDEIAVPASEIIHDRMNCLFHPLVGTSPIYACGTAANMGLEIERNSSAFFGNGSNPSGIITSPVSITPEKSAALSTIWNAQFGGQGSGGVAVLGDAMKFEVMRMSAVDSQLIEQLKWTAETVCATFHVPPFKVGLGTQPTYQNAEIMNQIYYSDCLQSHIEQFELCMDQALGLRTPTNTGRTLGVELDLDGLLRMDTAMQVDTLAKAIGGSLMTPNEARRKVDQKPLKGGDTVYLQQQYYSLEALAERDQNKPFSKPAAAVSGPDAVPAIGPGMTPDKMPAEMAPGNVAPAGRAADLQRRVSRRARLLRIDQIESELRRAFPVFENRTAPIQNVPPITVNVTVPERSTSLTIEGTRTQGRTGKITRDKNGNATIEIMEIPQYAEASYGSR